MNLLCPRRHRKVVQMKKEEIKSMTYFLILTTFKTKCIFKLKQHKKITSNSGNITEATDNYIIFGKLLHFSIYSFLTGKISCWHKLLPLPRQKSWFRRSGVCPTNLHLYQVPKCCCCYSGYSSPPKDHTPRT